MAAARSLVMTDVPGAREALGDASPAIVPVGDTAALAAAVAERLLDPALATREGAELRERVERDFDIRATTAAVAGLYDRLLGTRAPDLAAAT